MLSYGGSLVCLVFYVWWNYTVIKRINDSHTAVVWAGIAQSGWTVRGSNPGGGEIFRTRPDRPWGPPSLLYNEYGVSFPGVKRQGRCDYPPRLAPRLKKEYSYTSTPPLGLRGLV